MMRLLFLWVFLARTTTPVWAQTAYWVFFTDRAQHEAGQVSAETYAARAAQGLPMLQESDAFPTRAYVDAIEAVAQRPVRVRSRWLNAVTVVLSKEALGQVVALPFVQGVRPVAATHIARKDSVMPFRLGKAFGQIGGNWAAEEGLTGKGVHIGLIDAAFGNADKNNELTHLFTDKRITAYRDFENPAHTAAFFRRTTAEMDEHGAEVLSLVGGLTAGVGRWGGATGATFTLARTDNALKEYRREEDLWLYALEWMDSLGVRLINTSLGYGLGYTNPKENHTTSDVNGSTSPATRAVEIAAKEKGITVVVSAGNDGGTPGWGIINMPADAESCIAVGATYLDTWQKMSYSGVGPTWLPYLKPDVAAFSYLGTSFSAPVVTGGLACLMERYPNLKPIAYANALRASGHLHLAPNNYLGHGVPNLQKAAAFLGGALGADSLVRLKGKIQLVVDVGATQTASLVVFHKKDSRVVLKQTTVAPLKGLLTVVQEPGTPYTTLASKDKVWEIEWE